MFNTSAIKEKTYKKFMALRRFLIIYVHLSDNHVTRVMKLTVKSHTILLLLSFSSLLSVAQINTDRVMNIGRNALYFEDYILSMQYFNQVIKVKPYMAEPYFFRGIAKLSLDDYKGAEEDCTLCIERNPFIVNAYQVRGIARQNLGDYQGAIDDYAEGLRYAPEDRTFLNNKAIAEVQLKKYDEAEKSFDKLIALHPNYYNGYMSRAQFYLEKGDTIKAIADIDKAIEIDKYMSGAYAQRAIIKVLHDADYESALADMNEALRLDPKEVSYYFNRARIKYHQDDLQGAMADYDYILQLDPGNTMTHYNRGLLRMQVGERNKAISDFTEVIKAEPDNYFAIYNRALLYDMIGSYGKAVADFDVVLEQYPDFVAGFFARSEAKRKMGDMKGGEKDFMLALDLQKKVQYEPIDEATATAGSGKSSGQAADERTESDKNINKFNQILVADARTEYKPEYENKIRGRVQDQNVQVSIQPMYVLTYYERPDAVRQNIYYVKELEELNDTHVFAKKLLLTNSEAALLSDQVNYHFSSINDFSRLIEISPSNPLAYFGRAVDFMLVQDFASALDDLNRAIMTSRNFTMAYFLRAVVRAKQIEYEISAASTQSLDFQASRKKDANDFAPMGLSALGNESLKLEYEMVLRDYEKVIEDSPRFFYAYYNRGNLRCSQQDYRGAIADYTRAIELRPDFGDAYYNRGLVYLKQGDTAAGTADLSKAGELGVVSAYNLLKRLSD